MGNRVSELNVEFSVLLWKRSERLVKEMLLWESTGTVTDDIDDFLILRTSDFMVSSLKFIGFHDFPALDPVKFHQIQSNLYYQNINQTMINITGRQESLFKFSKNSFS